MINWTLQKRLLGQLKPYENNPRIRTDEGWKQLQQSIEEIGLAAVPNITLDNVILSGHQRVALLTEKYGAQHEIDVFVADHILTEQEMQDVVIWLNKAVAGEWDKKFIRKNFDVLGFDKYGFQPPERPGETDEDAVPVTPAEPTAKHGDIWILGQHRIACGDSTKTEDVEKLFKVTKCPCCGEQN